MKRGLIALTGPFLGLLLVSCASVQFTPTGPTYPPHDGPVKILKALPTDVPYEEIGWVSAEGDFNHPWSELLAMLQQTAAVKGANAIVLEEKFTTRMDTAQYNVGVNQNNESRSVTAIALRLKE
jgi:hypothetical protein